MSTPPNDNERAFEELPVIARAFISFVVVSGMVGTIVAIVLSLPTTGPLLFTALLTEDMYLAGSITMFLCFLTVLGTLVSDFLLVLVDPRIRMERKA